MYEKEKIMNVGGFDIIRITEDNTFVRYFAQRDGRAITRELATADAVKAVVKELVAPDAPRSGRELPEAGKSSALPRDPHPLSIRMYGLGKSLLRLFTLGAYPKPGRPHSVGFVTLFPACLLAAACVAITLACAR